MLKQLLPWILIGLSLLGGIGLFVYSMITGDEEEEETEGTDPLATTAADGTRLGDTLGVTSEEYRGVPRKSRMMALQESLEKSLDSREGVAQTSRNRMTMPWFLLVGADGSGKKTILSNTGLRLPYGE